MVNYVTVSEAAGIIGVSSDTIRRWSKRGLIKAKRSKLNYRLFNMDEVKRLHDKVSGKSKKNSYKILKSAKKTGYTVVELFAGAGGTALGFENAGLKHEVLVEKDDNCVKTLKKNKKNWNIYHGGIKDFEPNGIKADIVEGGFPCQSFSYAGKGLGFGDIRGTLFFEFIKVVKKLEPRIAVGENVRGLVGHDEGRTLATMVNKLDEIGYEVAYRVLKAQYFDVPQKRERLIIIGVKKGLGLPFFYPKEKDYTISLREAFHKCPRSPGQEYPPRKKYILSKVPPGEYWKSLPIKLQKEYMKKSYYLGGGKTGMARRLSWDEPSLTLTCSPAQKQTERCHPKETRPLTIREYARLQTFPDEWEFEGSISSQYRQIGNAVPVNLGYHIGRCLIAMLGNKFDDKTMEIEYPVNAKRLF